MITINDLRLNLDGSVGFLLKFPALFHEHCSDGKKLRFQTTEEFGKACFLTKHRSHCQNVSNQIRGCQTVTSDGPKCFIHIQPFGTGELAKYLWKTIQLKWIVQLR